MKTKFLLEVSSVLSKNRRKNSSYSSIPNIFDNLKEIRSSMLQEYEIIKKEFSQKRTQPAQKAMQLSAKLINYTQSVIDSLEEEEASDDIIAEYKEEFSNLTEQITSLRAIKKVVAKEDDESSSGEGQRELTMEDLFMSPESLNLKHKVEKYASFSSKLPVLKGKVGLIKGPVVFRPNNVLTEESYSKLGFKVTVLESMYPILEDQHLLIVDVAKVRKSLGSGSISKSKVVDEIRVNAQQAIEIYNHKHGSNYIFVRPEIATASSNKRLAFFWVMPSSSLSRLLNLKINGGYKINSWGVPF